MADEDAVMGLIAHREGTPGERAYVEWVAAPLSDTARYWHKMNRADKAKWEAFGVRIDQLRGAVKALEQIEAGHSCATDRQGVAQLREIARRWLTTHRGQ